MQPIGTEQERRKRAESASRMSRLAAAAFFAGAIAFVNPALAEDCSETETLLRAAARNPELPADAVRAVEAAVEQAMWRHANGDERGCQLRLALVRRVLEG